MGESSDVLRSLWLWFSESKETGLQTAGIGIEELQVLIQPSLQEFFIMIPYPDSKPYKIF